MAFITSANKIFSPNDNDPRRTLKLSKNCLIKCNILYYIQRNENSDMDSLLTFVPQSLKAKLLSTCHDDSIQLGIDKTYKKLLDHFFWPNMYDEVAEYVKGCTNCASYKPSSKTPSVTLYILVTTMT